MILGWLTSEVKKRSSFGGYAWLICIVNIVPRSHCFAGIWEISCAGKAVQKTLTQAEKLAFSDRSQLKGNHIAFDIKLNQMDFRHN